MPRKMFGCRLDASWHERAMVAVQRSGARSVQEWLEGVVQAEIVRTDTGCGVSMNGVFHFVTLSDKMQQVKTDA